MVLQMLRSKMPLTESALKHAANDFQAFTPWQPLPTPHYRPPLTSPRSPRAQKGAQAARARPRARQMTGAGLAARAAIPLPKHFEEEGGLAPGGREAWPQYGDDMVTRSHHGSG